MSSRAPSIVVVGADTLLGALPATPVQLAHACLRAGFHHVVPASWGDELVAGAVMRLVQRRPSAPAVQCSCPLVAHRLLTVSTDLRPFLVSLVSPPVALARYLRALYGTVQLRITYVGRCPGARDKSIDAHMLPDELFALFRERNIVMEDQPLVFDSVIPPDRRRHFSQPGGTPSVEALWSAGTPRTLVELAGDDLSIELAQLLLSDTPVLVDAAPALGCVCCGGSDDHDVDEGRALLESLEPPRSATPVVDTRVPVVLELPLQSSPPPDAHPAASSRREASAPPVARGDDDVPVRHVVMPPPSLPFHSEIEPPRQRAPAVPSGPVEPAERVEPVNPEPRGSSSDGPLAATASDEGGAAGTLAVATRAVPDERAIEPVAPSATSARAVDVAGFASPRRRTPVHGVARVTQGDVPKARGAEGRALPRAYVSHRRPSPATPRLADAPSPRDPETEAEPSASPREAPSANGSSSADQEADAASPDIDVVVSTPPRDDAFTVAPPAVVGVMVSERLEAASESLDISRSPARAPEAPRPRENERPVDLPLERLSDRSTTTHARERTRAATAPESAPARIPVRSWTQFVLVVVVVALLSVAAGAAIGAWYVKHRPIASGRP